MTTTKERYCGILTSIPSTIPVYNNSNLGYLMPSMDPCDDVFGDDGVEENTLGEYTCKPDNVATISSHHPLFFPPFYDYCQHGFDLITEHAIYSNSK